MHPTALPSLPIPLSDRRCRKLAPYLHHLSHPTASVMGTALQVRPSSFVKHACPSSDRPRRRVLADAHGRTIWRSDLINPNNVLRSPRALQIAISERARSGAGSPAVVAKFLRIERSFDEAEFGPSTPASAPLAVAREAGAAWHARLVLRGS